MRVAPPSMNPDGIQDARRRLRREMRVRRSSLPESERAAASRQFARHSALLLRPGRRIALYLPQGGEADPSGIIRRARQRSCTLYLPVVTDYRRHHMRFVRFDAEARLRLNRHRILEPHPVDAPAIPVRLLDLIVLPLVAFDERGWRLGSGAGFYDRHLRHLRPDRRWRRPKLIGLAYEFQCVPTIEPSPWDVPLDAVLTQRGLRTLRRTAPAGARSS